MSDAGGGAAGGGDPLAPPGAAESPTLAPGGISPRAARLCCADADRAFEAAVALVDVVDAGAGVVARGVGAELAGLDSGCCTACGG